MTSVLHVLNGDSTRGNLEGSGVPGAVTVWADVLHDGPVPDLPPDEFRAARARHLASYAGEPADEILRELQRWDAALERFGEHDELVFWFEHDLFDQLILIRHLHWLSGIERGNTRFSLICIGEFAGMPNFAGLGELSPLQLASLFPQRGAISQHQIDLGRRAWNLFRAPDPTALSNWIGSDDMSQLPFLEGALRRHLDDFPSTVNGLSRSERQILGATAQGHRAPTDIFVATQQMEERVFMGDATFWTIVRRMASVPNPLVTIDVADISTMPIEDGRVELAPAGQDILSGKGDHVALNGVDRWMGGAHLTTARHWRWDGARLHVNSQPPTPYQGRAD